MVSWKNTRGRVSWLGVSVGSLVSIILRLRVRPRLAMQKGVDNAQEIAISASPSIVLHNWNPLANIQILVLILEPRRSRWLERRSSSRSSNSLSSSRIRVRSIHSSGCRVRSSFRAFQIY
jgi:hypothetical protein